MISVGLIVPLVIRGLRGIAEIRKRSDIVLRTSVINKPVPMPLPPLKLHITRDDARGYFGKPANRQMFLDEAKYPGFAKSVEILNLELEEAARQGLVKDEAEYLSHEGSLKHLIVSSPDNPWSNLLKKHVNGSYGVNLGDASIPLERRRELALAFYMVESDRTKTESVAGRIALIVVDVLTEIGAEYVGLVVKDKELSRALETFLKTLSEPELEDLKGNEFLRHILKTTLVTISDNAEVITDNKLLESLIKSVSRELSGDVQALLAGKLYGKLVTVVLAETARHTDVFVKDELLSKVLSSVLDKAAKELPVKDLLSEKGLERLLTIGLKSVAENEELWIGQVDPPLLQKVIEGVVDTVRAKDANGLFKRETVVDLIDVAIGAVAKNPGLVSDSEAVALVGKALEVFQTKA